MTRKTLVFAAVMSIGVSVGAVLSTVAEAQKNPSESQNSLPRPIDELRPFNAMIGEWRGVGQLKRGSRKGAWTEKAICEWSFAKGQPAVAMKSSGGQQFEQLTLTWDSAARELVLTQHTQDGLRTYRGSIPKQWPGRVVLTSATDADGTAYRCTIQQLSDIRSTVLFEKQTSPTGSFRRVAGIGYTRAGTKLAVAGGNQRKCIVTGGLGTISVTHKGKTYYVCCQGCVQAFNDAPDEIIADYQASLKKK